MALKMTEQELRLMEEEKNEAIEKDVISLIKIINSTVGIPTEKEKDDIENLVYNSLEKSFLITSSWIKRVYGDTFNKPSKKDLERFSYDGKISERVRKHLTDFSKGVHAATPELEQSYKRILINELTRIINTESVHITNHLMWFKLKNRAKAVSVVGGHGSNMCDCEERWGMFAASKFTDSDLPPYHPECTCSIIVEI